ncbi:MAG: decarboxylating NADP(+)-dependent phosphogluconate dehydrogenase [Balneolales bacterium]
MDKSDIGVLGLGVMGSNLALNLEEKGYQVSVYNRTGAGEERITDDFIKGRARKKNITGTSSIAEFVTSLKRPHTILIMVKAGDAVDSVISQLLPYLDTGDILIDGGNSHYPDTGRRVRELAEKGIHFVGMGVSGGEEGARFGPSLMPGGDPRAWQSIQPILSAIAAKAEDGTTCCAWVGDGGAGHFVKMVHNGIEYADMQLIAEAYHFMRSLLGMQPSEIAKTFDEWNQGDLSSYLLEITSQVLTVSDEDGTPLVDRILDSAGQKGTGKWVAVTALELGIPLPVITESVFSRIISSEKGFRAETSRLYTKPANIISSDKYVVFDELKGSLLAGRVMSLAEGFNLIDKAAEQFGWSVELPAIAQIWREGCIIRSSLLEPIISSYAVRPDLRHLLHAPYFKEIITRSQQGWRNTISRAIQAGIPVPAMSSALSQFDALRCERLPANLIQAQRDYFGAHQYERIDKPRDTFFHTEWKNI